MESPAPLGRRGLAKIDGLLSDGGMPFPNDGRSVVDENAVEPSDALPVFVVEMFKGELMEPFGSFFWSLWAKYLTCSSQLEGGVDHDGSHRGGDVIQDLG